jgi:S-adenosylmethionine:tRNA ribosyltransferase-isomerase
MALMLQDFSFTLPASLIAQSPLTKRDESKLLVCQDGLIQHRTFHELPSLLPANALLIANDTKVFPARLLGQTKKGVKVDVIF